MSRFFTVASSSSGNCAYVGTSEYGLLVDLGVSAKACTLALEAHDVDLSQVRGILVTHEHIDHIRGLKVFLKKNQIPVYGSAAVLEYLAVNDCVPPQAQLVPLEGEAVFGEIRARAFRTSHDSLDSFGYHIELGAQSCCVLTDSGVITEEMGSQLESCDLVMIESNYDPHMLACGRYPYPLKRRIDSDNGHLSNEQCAAAVWQALCRGSKRFVLAHLSKENNYPRLAYETVAARLDSNGAARGVDYQLTVAPQFVPGETILF